MWLFTRENLRRWTVHPAIEPDWIQEWMAGVPLDTPPLTERAAFALTRLFHLEGCSAENAVLIAACSITAATNGWEQVCTLVGIPPDETKWPDFRRPDSDAIAAYFEDWFDATVGPDDDTDAYIERLKLAQMQQLKDHEGWGLAAVLAQVTGPKVMRSRRDYSES
ncbi:hypothetical protein ACXU4B_13640 [Dyella soli]|uniref:Uncharacterized protein n=1 Tax=Dyella soli TaxID=522319 RepID=A0A4R0YF13_9GAMM|nr:hypothetical protein [Dyella soli]TCI06826.1 hypothetical protein EZM97_29795 [Dyella soli]